MPLEVTLREGETLDSLLQRFRRVVQTDGVLRDLKAHRYFMSKREAAALKRKRAGRRRSKR